MSLPARNQVSTEPPFFRAATEHCCRNQGTKGATNYALASICSQAAVVWGDRAAWGLHALTDSIELTSYNGLSGSSYQHLKIQD